MKKYIIAIIVAVVLGIISYFPKQDKPIAIDVLLIPSEEVYNQALQLNSSIHHENPTGLKLDENHIPHITLLQCYIQEEDLPKVCKALEGIYKTIEKDTLVAESLYYSKDTQESFAMIRIEKSKPLIELHKKTITLLKPYMVANGSENAFIPNPDGRPIRKSTIDYVPNFVHNYSFENYDPHISIGMAKTTFLDSLSRTYFQPLKFRATSVCIYQLGDFGTAQRLFWKSE